MEADIIYNRQQELHLLMPQKVAVVGCGGVGAWVALLLAMSGVPHIELYDPDRIEASNLNRLPFTIHQLDQYKAEATRELIIALRPDITCNAYIVKFPLEDFHNDYVLPDNLIDCTDTLISQGINYKWSVDYGVTYTKLGYDGTHFMVADKLPGWVQEKVPAVVDENGKIAAYNFIPSWVVPAIAAAAMGVAKLMKFPLLQLSMDIGDVGQPRIVTQEVASPELCKTCTKKDSFDDCDRCKRDECKAHREMCDDCYRGDCDDCDKCDGCRAVANACENCGKVDADEVDFGNCNECVHRDCEDCRAYNKGLADGPGKCLNCKQHNCDYCEAFMAGLEKGRKEIKT
jgi:hypothetical protein